MNDAAAPTPLADPRRLAALRRTALLDSAAEAAFDRFTSLASRLLQAPISLITLVDAERQFFKSAVGLAEPWSVARQTALSHSFCQHVVATGMPFVVEDAAHDPRVLDNRAVEELGVAAYAGVPLAAAAGEVLGSFCVIDKIPRVWLADEIAVLQDLAALIMTEIERRLTVVELEEARRKLQSLTDALPVQISEIAADERYRFINALYPERLRKPAEQILDHTVREVLGDAAYALVEPHIRAVLAGEPQRFEIALDNLGTTLEVSYTPQRDCAGAIAGFYVLAVDITARKAAELAAQQALARADLALQAGHMGIWEWDIVTGKVIWSDQMYQILGLPLPAPGAEPPEFLDLVYPEDRPRIAASLNDQVDRCADNRFECRIQPPDGEPRWIRSHSLYRADPLRGDRIYGVCADITERKLAEHSQHLLLEELNHRVRNTLTIVNSIAGQTLKHSRSLESFREAFLGRIQALGDTHTLLSNNRWQPSSLAALIARQLSPYTRGRADALATRGPDIFVGPKPALTLSLVIHELATNAAKYGALSTDVGRVEVVWSIERAPERRLLRMVWEEQGGPPAQPPQRTGFGAQLIRFNIAHEFGGTVEASYPLAGVRYDFTIPLAASGNRL